MLLHELANPIYAHTDATRQKFLEHALPAVFASTLGLDGADVGQQGFVAVASGTAAFVRFTLAQPVEVPARAHHQHTHDTLTAFLDFSVALLSF